VTILHSNYETSRNKYPKYGGVSGNEHVHGSGHGRGHGRGRANVWNDESSRPVASGHRSGTWSNRSANCLALRHVSQRDSGARLESASQAHPNGDDGRRETALDKMAELSTYTAGKEVRRVVTG
jgi:hypothetical protein